MKHTFLIPVLLLLVAPFLASAHQTRVIDLDGMLYQLTVGSLNEPLVVDDKTGLDLTVKKIGPAAWYGARVAKGDIPKNAVPVEGLDAYLNTSISAGKILKEMELTAVYGEPGSYKTTFYPVNTAPFIYHIEGEIDGKPVHQMFACNPAGHVMNAMSTTTEDVHTEAAAAHEKLEMHDDGEIHHESLGSVVYERGAFGCAQDKAAFGFPHNTASVAQVLDATQPTPIDHVTFALSVLGVLGALYAAVVTRRG